MARRRRTMTAKQARYFAPRSAPRTSIIRVSAPSPRRRGRVRRAASRVGGFISNHSIDRFVGGALYGFAVKAGLVQRLPAVPIIGRTGTAALVADYWARHGGGELARKVATAAAVLAGYQLGSTGSIVGDDLQTTGHYETAADYDEYD